MSTLVILRRVFETGGATSDEFWRAFAEERERIEEILATRKPPSGGDFHNVHTI